jgi:prepilin signal peptidase PulO-like enzyme (type II secretory pathway)
MSRSRWAVVVGALVALVATWMRYPQSVDRVVLVALVLGGGMQAESDLRTRHVPRFVTYVMAAVIVSVSAVTDTVEVPAIIAAAAVAVGFFVVHRWRPHALGFGDVLLAPVVALYVGWFDVGAIPLWLLGASVIAAFGAVVRQRRYVAFVPSMVASALITILYFGVPTYSG